MENTNQLTKLADKGVVNLGQIRVKMTDRLTDSLTELLAGSLRKVWRYCAGCVCVGVGRNVKGRQSSKQINAQKSEYGMQNET
eukprot:scaffold278678_cov19-Prasinocladus_malaysianus.AAC.1